MCIGQRPSAWTLYILFVVLLCVVFAACRPSEVRSLEFMSADGRTFSIPNTSGNRTRLSNALRQLRNSPALCASKRIFLASVSFNKKGLCERMVGLFLQKIFQQFTCEACSGQGVIRWLYYGAEGCERGPSLHSYTSCVSCCSISRGNLLCQVAFAAGISTAFRNPSSFSRNDTRKMVSLCL